MPKGVSDSFDLNGRKTQEMKYTPLKAGIYAVTLDASASKVDVQPRKMPRVHLALRYKKPGAKKAMKIMGFFGVSTTPSEESGKMQVDFIDNLKGLTAAIDPDGKSKFAWKQKTFKAEYDGEVVTKTAIDPDSMEQWLQNNDGAGLAVKLKVRGDRNEVEAFLPLDAADSSEDEAEGDDEDAPKKAPADDEDDEEEAEEDAPKKGKAKPTDEDESDDDEEEEEDEDEDDEEPLPAKSKVKAKKKGK